MEKGGQPFIIDIWEGHFPGKALDALKGALRIDILRESPPDPRGTRSLACVKVLSRKPGAFAVIDRHPAIRRHAGQVGVRLPFGCDQKQG
jgi:hypothetical protein